MITVKAQVTQQKVFDAIRATIQGVHPGAVFDEDSCGSPFLLKSVDAKVWVRVFYQPMGDMAPDELRRELARLKVLMPQDAFLYLFFPSLDQTQMSSYRAVSDRLAFFEYGGLMDEQAETRGIKVRKWIPASASSREPVTVKAPIAGKGQSVLFLDYSRLSADEIADLTELGLSLR